MNDGQELLKRANWKFFLLTSIFSVSYGNKFDLNKMGFDNPKINFVSRTGGNNGVSSRVDEIEGKHPYEAGCITVALGGSIGSSFVQQKPFYTGQNVAVLKPKEPMSQSAALFVCAQIMNECHKRFVAFGRELNIHIKRDFGIGLPTDEEGKPDWALMADVVDSIPHETESTGIEVETERIERKWADFLDVSKWKPYKLSELFKFQKGKRIIKEEMDEGNTPFVAAISDDNGIRNGIDETPMFEANKITVNYNGSVGESFYQDKPFCASDDVNVLTLKNHDLNKYVALFLCALIKANRFRFSYGRKWKLERMKETIVKIPVKEDGSPDLEGMENFIKALPYSDRI